MKTDDFLADLEAQLRDARPRPGLRPALAVVPLALIVAAVLFLAEGGRERNAVPTASGGWTEYAPLEGGSRAVTVVLGKNELGAGIEPIAILDGSGRAGLEAQVRRLLRAHDLLVGASGGGGMRVSRTAVVARDSSSDDLAADVRRALGLPPASRQYSSEEHLDWMSGADVLVVLGTDYELPAPP